MLDVAAARKELSAKTLLDIERATALTWGGRAAASFQMAKETKDQAERIRRLQEGENYRQEAIEHAAMTEDIEFLVQMREAMDKDRQPAISLAS